MRHIVGLSGGKDSTAMALRLAQVEPKDYEFVITPTKRELPVMQEHWKRIEGIIGKPLTVIPGPSLMDLIIKYRALPNWRMRWCTRQVKIEPFMAYALSAKPATSYIGIRADEADGDTPREGTDWSGIEGVTQDLPLVRWGWGIREVTEYLAFCNVEIPKRTDCDWCFFQRLIEWYELWRDHPDLWKEGEAVELFTGHTFRSDQRDTWPASMAGLRAEFERGKVPPDTRKTQPKRTTMCSWCAR